MLTRAHRVAGQRARNRRGNSTRSAAPAGSLPFESHVILRGRNPPSPQCQRRCSGPILILPGLNREMARPKMRAKREQFIKNHRPPPAARNRLNPGNERVLPLSPASRDSFPAPHSSSSTSIRATTHEGITRQACNITGTSKIKCTCVCFRPHSQMSFFLQHTLRSTEHQE